MNITYRIVSYVDSRALLTALATADDVQVSLTIHINKFGTTIKTTECSMWVVQTCVQQTKMVDGRHCEQVSANADGPRDAKSPTVIGRCCVDNTWKRRRGQLLSTVDDDRHLFFFDHTHATIQLCVMCIQCDGRLA